ncbi:MAG: hypothetical protein ACKOEC_06250 [Acidimicrobiia bacterium]
MRLKNIVWTAALIVSAVVLSALISTATVGAEDAGGVADPKTVSGRNAAGDPAKATQIARGKHLVDIMGCHDCHTPMKMGPKGPEWDMTRALFAYLQSLSAIKNRTPQPIELAEPK